MFHKLNRFDKFSFSAGSWMRERFKPNPIAALRMTLECNIGAAQFKILCDLNRLQIHPKFGLRDNGCIVNAQ